MGLTDRALCRAVAGALLLTVASQIFYVVVVANAGPETVLRPLTWFTELFAFALVAIAGSTLSARRPAEAMLWSTIGLSGLLNVLQVAMGLAMFAPAMEIRETVPQLFATVLAGAFFLYFLAKFLLGAAGILLGMEALRAETSMGKTIGALALLSGLAAVLLNLLGMIDAKAWTFAAGAAGTAVTAFVGLMLAVPNMATSTGRAAT
ncbi:hypothetical protein K3172_08670 [Qipengyuania sp. 6B39]|uniref:hypothetical protein n=1 Tax=Qipengyuania proteolytica TaxID=2867239 RepID=UPI001C8992E2|nr:hypothetical protein [Qipengyuania proteolytica]MBX7495924.1 hypothetical protein [Qipengyuania proteolytica]